MDSRIATRKRAEILAATQRLTPTVRLDAFVTHCRLVFDLYRPGLGTPQKRPAKRPESRS